ncbi:exportin-5 [Mus musculus]|uniref:Exportin-5 n=1 Tax=Mus musculus TaxID=10090 RepID=XPO5_MOUSE|nr:exportin-5 [Mus musculus]Q924C1.1 RecName: Full=Exportin-5; Short=Exp5; AltName: Full=Ran-binding protein 21 [Mus musculus]AAI31662.1 Exportin 5 [Mus musculus]AAK68050.1 RanBp21 [Mus musculus]|eukprot:NP_082474.1 exportin-5 [Mus musculus]
MEMEQVNALCEELVKAVTVMMDPSSTQRYRLEALKFCEEFKEKCPICVPCGLKLAEKTQIAIVRHFGLQILEHVVKFRWNSMSRLEKVYLKNSVMELIANGTLRILEEENHIKDVLSRIVVEMIKREWPQHWPDMLMELDTLFRQGETQRELVMFILLRLAEDVVTFQTLPTQRRRDIQQTLTQNMERILNFLLNTLQENVNKYQQMKTDSSQEAEAQANCRVSVAALNTLAGYIDWVSLNHITAENCKLVETLCLLLNEQELQLGAAECLLIAVSRKGKLEDRKRLMILFGDVAMHYILSAAQTADGGGLVEKHYLFLKRLCQVLCALGNLLCALLALDANIQTPINFGMYLESFLAFTTHPSQFLRSSTHMTWGALFRHEVLSRDPALLAVIPKYLRASMTNLVKMGFPSKTDSPSCEYSRFDFDSDEDFNAFFNSSRAQHGEVVRCVCRLDPKTSFQMAAEWLKYQLSASIDTGPVNSCSTAGTGEGGFCSIFSPSYVQWEAMTFFLESVINQMFRTLDKEELPVSDGIELLQLVLNFEIKDPLVLSCVLTNVSALFPFVTYKPAFLPQVFSKLFSFVTFESVGESKAPRTRAVRNVRRHACSSINKMCRDYPDLVLPNFDMLYSHVKQLLSNELLLTQMEKCALMEALVLVSNQFKDYERQKLFLEELMAPVVNIWLSEEMCRALSDIDSFIAYVGADLKSCDPAVEDPCGLNRARMSFCVYSILGVMRRTSWPSDLEEAKAGGFVVGYTPSGNPIFRNPCTEQILRLLDNLLALVRTHNTLYTPEMLTKMAEPFTKALDIVESEKTAILGLPQPLLEFNDHPVYRTTLERMQRFFGILYENCYHILGKAGPSMQQDFYTVEDLASQLLGSAFVNLNNIPDFRLRSMLRVFVKPLVLFCPSEHYETLISPILGPLFTYLHMRLSQKWHVINQRSILCGEDEIAEDNPESQEMLEEQLVRMLTREAMDLIMACCVSKKTADHTAAPTADGDDEEMMATEVAPSSVVELTDLGKCLMKHEDVCTALLITAFNSLTWKDTLSCQRATTQLCWPLLKQVMSGTLLADAVTWLFTSVLKGLQMHGQHDGCMASLVHLAFQIYEALRPRYLEIRAVMEQIPEINKESLDQFDCKLLNPSLQKAADKRRKDHFKRLIAGCIGKPLGEQFRKEVHIKNLPWLFKKPKPMLETEVLDSEEGGLATIFEP